MGHTECTEGIAAIVLSRDRPDFFDRCSAALVDEPLIVQRLLVQNGRDTETEATAEARGWRVLKPGRNLSFAVGNNLAARTTTASHLLLLNNDAIVQPGTIQALWERRERRLVGSLIVETTGRVNHAGGGLQSSGPFHMGRGEDPQSFTEDIECPWVTFACVLIEHQLYRRLEGLDEGYWYSVEDLDFCLRAYEHGVRPVVACRARVVHDEKGTRTGIEDSRNFKRFGERWLDTGRLQRAMRHVG